jgi:broad specificity phosphatase PhoE
MTITRVYLSRHGETTLMAEDRFAGSTDVELSDVGRGQVEALARRLAKEPIEHVYTSPLRRARITADAIARPHGLVPTEASGLREIDHGRWEGKGREDVAREFPDEYAAWTDDPFRCAPEGGESGVQAMARALMALRGIVERHPGATVALVSHKATIRLVLCSLLGIDARGYRDKLDQSPASLNALEFKNPGQARLLVYNDISHYAAVPASSHSRLSPVWTEALPN